MLALVARVLRNTGTLGLKSNQMFDFRQFGGRGLTKHRHFRPEKQPNALFWPALVAEALQNTDALGLKSNQILDFR